MKIIFTEQEFRTYIKQLIDEFKERPLNRLPLDQRKTEFGDSHKAVQDSLANSEKWRDYIDERLKIFERRPSFMLASDIINGITMLNKKGTMKQKWLEAYYKGTDIDCRAEAFADRTFNLYRQLYKYKMDYIEKFLKILSQHPEVGIEVVVAEDSKGQRAMYFIRKEDFNPKADGEYFHEVSLGDPHTPINVDELNQYGIKIPSKLRPLKGFDNEDYVYDPQLMNYVKKEDNVVAATDMVPNKFNEMYSNENGYEVVNIQGCHNVNGLQYGAIMKSPQGEISIVKSEDDRKPIQISQPYQTYDEYDPENMLLYKDLGNEIHIFQLRIAKNGHPEVSKNPVNIIQESRKNIF